ncbi:heparan sulfate glucosamine 3-O-sulfotransferase 1-like isoform X2 [Paramacrobiotus metropolitanus]|nr:heparan sulfate glucosamine 3-O-sulfotransferase 1-like isoform X2 [Paramacrobiotus metropolitanus]
MLIDFKLPAGKNATSAAKTPASTAAVYSSTVSHIGLFSHTITVVISIVLLMILLLYFAIPLISAPESGDYAPRNITAPMYPWLITWTPPLLYSDLFFPLNTEKPRWTRDRLMRRLPSCLIIGVRKSGTRALIEFLSLHSRITKASDEVHFFDEEQNYQKGREWYRRQMPFSYEDQITVEKSPAYFITRYVPQRVKSMNASIALILVVKNPVTRVISDYTQTLSNRIKKGKNYLSFEDSVLREDGSVDVSYKPIRVSLYYKHLTAWLRVFPREQILIVDGDTLIANPIEELRRVEAFLRLPAEIRAEQFHYNTTKGFYCIRDTVNPYADKCLSHTKGRKHPEVAPEVVDKLTHFFRPYNDMFYQMVGRNFSW